MDAVKRYFKGVWSDFKSVWNVYPSVIVWLSLLVLIALFV